ncbi:MAG: thioredoxin family protein [Caldisericaceae bacterium]|nr:thioredoxin family protein [Caldisericaceae bacterium]
MNLLNYFNQALTIDEYLPLLKEQATLYQYHYRRALSHEVHGGDLPPLKILIITEPWCGDSTAIVPALQKFFENKSAGIRIALRDQNDELMNMFFNQWR